MSYLSRGIACLVSACSAGQFTRNGSQTKAGVRAARLAGTITTKLGILSLSCERLHEQFHLQDFDLRECHAEVEPGYLLHLIIACFAGQFACYRGEAKASIHAARLAGTNITWPGALPLCCVRFHEQFNSAGL
jgi:hypothetical protein